MNLGLTTSRSWLPALLALAFVCLMLAITESLVTHLFPPVPFDSNYQVRIQREKPDIILLGNSTVGKNLDKKLLAAELSRLAGRPIRVTLLWEGGMHSAWQYLVIKNQIIPSVTRKVPIVLVDYEDYFLQPSVERGAGPFELNHKIMMQGEESVFLAKLGENAMYFKQGFPNLFTQRYVLRRNAVASFVIPTLRLSSLGDILQHRPNNEPNVTSLEWLLSRIFNGGNFRSGDFSANQMHMFDTAKLAEPQEFEKLAQDSFVPEILTFSDRYPLTFALSVTNPAFQDYRRYLDVFSPAFDSYLRAHNAKFIDMNRRSELTAPGLMRDSRHFTRKEGTALNTKIFAEELVKNGVLTFLAGN